MCTNYDLGVWPSLTPNFCSPETMIHQIPGGALHEWNKYNLRIKWVWAHKQGTGVDDGIPIHIPFLEAVHPSLRNCEHWLLIIPSHSLLWRTAIGQWGLPCPGMPGTSPWAMVHANDRAMPQWSNSVISCMPCSSLWDQDEARSHLKPHLRLASSSALSCSSHFLTGFPGRQSPFLHKNPNLRLSFQAIWPMILTSEFLWFLLPLAKNSHC